MLSPALNSAVAWPTSIPWMRRMRTSSAALVMSRWTGITKPYGALVFPSSIEFRVLM